MTKSKVLTFITLTIVSSAHPIALGNWQLVLGIFRSQNWTWIPNYVNTHLLEFSNWIYLGSMLLMSKCILKWRTMLIKVKYYFTKISVKLRQHFGYIHLLNTCKYWANTWKMCSPASDIPASIDAIIVSFEAILFDFKT